ncbi:MAG: hypothetical protein EAZ28_25860 [Oscillatoriales cyanobacterium]|nr:MAG: hypothetical protein EAZ28_25860 [Oscillatoriales cyanobacterium]
MINRKYQNVHPILWLGGGGFINIWDGNYRWLVNPPLRNLVIQEYIENSKIGRGGFAEIAELKNPPPPIPDTESTFYAIRIYWFG